MVTPVQLNSELHGDEGQDLITKILVLEYDDTILNPLKIFLTSNNIIGYKVTKDKILSVLNCSVDLGAIFIPEMDEHGKGNIELAIEIHRARPELPIFLRRESDNTLSDYAIDIQRIFSGAYVNGQYEHLHEMLDTFLFTRHYPSEFVNSVKELTIESFKATFKNTTISVDSPYIVKDKIIYGELFSLMPLESSWCRGYMMLQTEEGNIMDVISSQKTSLNPMEPNFRDVNTVLGELSNMIWGGFKKRYGISLSDDISRVRVEVPIMINHTRKYISFGSDDPQLCFKYTLTDPEGKIGPILMYQKFVFSLDWSPENYEENEKNVDELVDNGALELF